MHAAANIEPLIATGRQPHHPSWRERFAAPPPEPENPTPVSMNPSARTVANNMSD
jgi:hypothetical protein